MVEEYSLISEENLKKPQNIGGKMEVLRCNGSKSSLVIGSPMTCMQSTETTFAEILPVRIPRIGSSVFEQCQCCCDYQAFPLLGVFLLSYK